MRSRSRSGSLAIRFRSAVHGAALAVRGGPALLDRLDQPGGAVGDDQQRRSEPAGDQVAAEGEPVLVHSRIPSITASRTRRPAR